MTPAQSDLALLEVARRSDFYGVKLHPAKDSDDTAGHLSVLHQGIKAGSRFKAHNLLRFQVYQQLQCVSTFSWGKIRKLSFKRKKLLIKLHPDGYVSIFSFFGRGTAEACLLFIIIFSSTPRIRPSSFLTRGTSARTSGRSVSNTTPSSAAPRLTTSAGIIASSARAAHSGGGPVQFEWNKRCFRFTGRTQKQLIDYVREHHKRREPFTR